MRFSYFEAQVHVCFKLKAIKLRNGGGGVLVNKTKLLIRQNSDVELKISSFENWTFSVF